MLVLVGLAGLGSKNHQVQGTGVGQGGPHWITITRIVVTYIGAHGGIFSSQLKQRPLALLASCSEGESFLIGKEGLGKGGAGKANLGVGVGNKGGFEDAGNVLCGEKLGGLGRVVVWRGEKY